LRRCAFGSFRLTRRLADKEFFGIFSIRLPALPGFYPFGSLPHRVYLLDIFIQGAFAHLQILCIFVNNGLGSLFFCRSADSYLFAGGGALAVQDVLYHLLTVIQHLFRIVARLAQLLRRDLRIYIGCRKFIQHFFRRNIHLFCNISEFIIRHKTFPSPSYTVYYVF
jgi:hypothetical protein